MFFCFANLCSVFGYKYIIKLIVFSCRGGHRNRFKREYDIDCSRKDKSPPLSSKVSVNYCPRYPIMPCHVSYFYITKFLIAFFFLFSFFYLRTKKYLINGGRKKKKLKYINLRFRFVST